MIGLVQKVLFDAVEALAGPAALAEVKRRADVPADKVFRLSEVYDDGEWQRLFAAACEVLRVTPEQAERAYADFFMRDALRRFPMWFRMAGSAREFLVRQPAIHNGFATSALDPAQRRAIVAKFRIEQRDGELVMHYRSPNRHCGLYKELAQWILNHYRERASVSETQCLKRGDPECEIHIRWE